MRVKFADACLSGDAITVQQYLPDHPDFATTPVPNDWHAYHIMRRGRQPVDHSLNPGVMNASGTVYLRATYPAYPLHLAAGNGHETVVALLLAAKAPVEAGDGDGDTALTWATWCARRSVMERLMVAGADTSFADQITIQAFKGTKGDGASLKYLKDKRNTA